MAEKLRVLIVEDCDDDALLVAHELRGGGHELEYERVETADQVKAALAGGPWDLVIADYALPGLSALRTLEILQSSGLDLPVIIVSGTIGEETAVAAMKAGAHDYVMKSNLSRLNPVVERELREAAVRRQRRAAEMAVHDREGQLETIFDHAPVAMLVVDQELRVRRINRAGEQLSGAGAGQPTGERIGSALGCLHALEDPGGCTCTAACIHCPVSQAVQQTFIEGVAQRAVEARLPVSREHDRAVLQLLVSATPIELAGEQLVLACLEDITDRKRAADALAQYAAALERTNCQLEMSRKELEQFLYTSSHDLRSPIVSIHGFATLLRERAGEQLDPQSLRYLERIQANAETIEALLRDLLHMSRIDPRDAASHEVALDGLAQSVCDAYALRARERGIRLIRQPGLPSVRGQQQTLQEALAHLVDNAIKFMPARPDGVVDIGYDAHVRTPEGSLGAFFVRDNGDGIAPAYHERIFQLFRRGPCNAPDAAGTGVGLAIVTRIIHAHGGSVWVESTPGEGATFYFSLTLADRTQAPADANPRHEPRAA